MRFTRVGTSRSAVLIALALAASSTVVGTAGAAFPGGNGKIAFAKSSTQSIDIYTMNPDGTGVVNLTNTSTLNGTPAWSADGRKIAYFGFTANHEEIFTMNADGSGRRQVTTQELGDFSPSWSPDGTKIAFFTFRHSAPTPTDRNLEIYVMSPDGSNQVRLTDHPAGDISPRFSPDGSKIAFRSTRDGNPEIYVMNADGTNPFRLTDNPAADSIPEWSPDGTKLAYVSNRDGGNFEIYVMNADGTNPTRLTENPAEDSEPAWSPDGTKIAFSTDRDGAQVEGRATPRDIFVMNADGSAQTNITRSPNHNDESPSWQPLLDTPPSSTTTTTAAPSTTTTTPSTTSTTTAPPASRTFVSSTFGSRGSMLTVTASGVDVGKYYALFFADRTRLASGPCHLVGIKVGGPSLSGGDGTVTATARVPVNAARGAAQVCFALKNNRANHSDAGAFHVL